MRDQTADGGAKHNAVSGREVDNADQMLSKLIVGLELAPGSVVSLSELMALLGCGRTPIRLALERLVERGLVTSVPQRGIYVAPLNVDEFTELFEFNAIVQGAVARFAAERISEEELASLDRLIDQADALAAIGDYEGWTRVAHELNEHIWRASRNRYATQTASRLFDLLHRFGLIAERKGQSPLSDWCEWGPLLREVVQALRRRDPDEAERKIRQLSQIRRERLKAIM